MWLMRGRGRGRGRVRGSGFGVSSGERALEWNLEAPRPSGALTQSTAGQGLARVGGLPRAEVGPSKPLQQQQRSHPIPQHHSTRAHQTPNTRHQHRHRTPGRFALGQHPPWPRTAPHPSTRSTSPRSCRISSKKTAATTACRAGSSVSIQSLLFLSHRSRCSPHTHTPRRRRVPRPCRLQLPLGPVAARAAAGQDPGQRLAVRHAQQEHGHHGHLARPGLAGRLEAGQMKEPD